MTLTEQWKNGELQNNWYYIRTTNGIEKWEYTKQAHGFGYEEDVWVVEVLAPVPSYEEWRRLQSSWVDEMGKAVDLQKALEWSNEQYNTKVPVLEIENQQLKELLKECRQSFMGVRVQIEEYEYSMARKTAQIAIDDIDNAIGEK